jgi:hypothetical protein
MKNPKFTPDQEAEIERAERLGTRATIFELGVGEYLKSHMPCGSDTAEAQAVLGLSVALRDESRHIHSTIGRAKSGRRRA